MISIASVYSSKSLLEALTKPLPISRIFQPSSIQISHRYSDSIQPPTALSHLPAKQSQPSRTYFVFVIAPKSYPPCWPPARRLPACKSAPYPRAAASAHRLGPAWRCCRQSCWGSCFQAPDRVGGPRRRQLRLPTWPLSWWVCGGAFLGGGLSFRLLIWFEVWLWGLIGARGLEEKSWWWRAEGARRMVEDAAPLR